MLDMDLLPTNINPETAVSYELIYSPNDEHLELYKKGEKVNNYPLSAIKSLDVRPGDVVRVLLDKELLGQLKEKGLMLVDMPGIDSGIEAHNAAIANYLMSGTHYMVFSDAEQGTIRSTALSFLNELSKYDNIDFSIFISKADKKSQEDLDKIQSQATELVERRYPKHPVGISSSVDKRFDDVLNALYRIDAEKILADKFKGEVILSIDQMIQALQRNVQLLTGNIKDADNAISEIQEKKNDALSNLMKKKERAQSLEGSADDIVNDVREAIIKNSSQLASQIMQNANADQLNNAVMQILRPVFVNSFKRELSEYQEEISSVVIEFSNDIDKILKDSDNKVLAGAEQFVGDLVGKDIIEGLLVKGLEKAALKFAGYKGIGALLNGMSKILGPIAIIIVNIIPDILKLIFGKGSQRKLAEIQSKICNDIAGRIAEGMRSKIESMLAEQRDMADRQMENMINREAGQIDESIRESIKARSLEKDLLQKRIIEYTQAAEELNSLKLSL